MIGERRAFHASDHQSPIAIDLPRGRRSRHGNFITKQTIVRYGVTENGDVIFGAGRQSQRCAQRISDVAHILVVIAARAPEDLVPHYFGGRRSLPGEPDGSSRWGGCRRGSCASSLS